MKSKKPLSFRFIKFMIRVFYPKTAIEKLCDIPKEPAVIVGNHCQMHGPIVCELFFPDNVYTWCAGQMMSLKDVPAYAYRDFWSHKPSFTKPFFKLLSYLIAPLSVIIFNNARTIAVHRDTRILSTFRESMKKLSEGNSVVVFPEHDVEHNNIVYDFQDRFIELARFYHRKYGVALSFVPMYIAPDLKKAYLGAPTKYDPSAPAEEERRRICDYLMEEITDIAVSLPRHTVVPYRNVSRKDYPTNVPEEASDQK